MNTYGCWCYLTVIAKDGEADFERYVDLPCPPFVDLDISFDEGQVDYFKVEDVIVDAETGTFWLSEKRFDCDSECRCGPGSGCCVLNVSYYTKLGWTLRASDTNPRFGFDRTCPTPGMFEPEKHFMNKPDDQ